MTTTPEQLRLMATEMETAGNRAVATGLPNILRAHADALEEIERLRAKLDAAFAMSRCECESNECCANLVKAQERADIDAHQLAVMTEMAGANHAAWKRAERIDALEECLREAARNLDSIANWRREALSYDADMDNPPRSFCEDIELVEQAAKDAADKARALLEEK